MAADRTDEALRIIAQYRGITAEEFGRDFWPESKWPRLYRATYRKGHANATLRLAAGRYLGKLREKGLVYRIEGRESDPIVYTLAEAPGQPDLFGGEKR